LLTTDTPLPFRARDAAVAHGVALHVKRVHSTGRARSPLRSASSLELLTQPFRLGLQGGGSLLEFEEVPLQLLALRAQGVATLPEVV
jgi:hypothetical protein